MCIILYFSLDLYVYVNSLSSSHVDSLLARVAVYNQASIIKFISNSNSVFLKKKKEVDFFFLMCISVLLECMLYTSCVQCLCGIGFPRTEGQMVVSCWELNLGTFPRAASMFNGWASL